MQKDIENKLVGWSRIFDLKLNFEKCNVITFSKYIFLVLNGNIIGNHYLKRVECLSELGVLFNSYLNFRIHVDFINTKANSILQMSG